MLSTPGLVTKRDVSALPIWVKDTEGYISTYTDLSDMVKDMTDISWVVLTGFYYEDPKDAAINCFFQVVEGGCSEMQVTRNKHQFESFIIGWMDKQKLFQDILDILGATDKECRTWKYAGKSFRLGDEYAKYAKDLV